MLISIIVAIFIGYFLGSIPVALVLVKVFKNKDIRTIGSGNIGTTNVMRAGYPILALFTLVLDVFKGAIAVIICSLIFTEQSINLSLIAGVSAILGHIFPVWLKFKGGKGVATTLGTIFVISPLVGLSILFTWIIVFAITKYSSLAAITAAVTLPIYAFLWNDNYLFLYMIPVAVLILYKHNNNIKRLLNGSESKITLFTKK